MQMVKGIYLEVPFVKPQCPLKCAQPHLTPRLLQSPVKNLMTNVIQSHSSYQAEGQGCNEYKHTYNPRMDNRYKESKS